MEKNIFETAAKQSKKKIPLVHENDNVDSKPIEKLNPAVLKEILSKKYGAEDPEIMEMCVRMQEMKHDLDKQLEEVRKRGEECHFDVDAYLKKALQVHPSELEKNIKKQQIFKDKVNNIFPPEACMQKIKKSSEKLTQERKNKSLGSRKKWIPVR